MASALTRREALRHLATGTAAAASAPLWVEHLLALADQHAAHKPSPEAPKGTWAPKVFNAPQNELVIVLSELIIPQTDTPGAKAAKVNEYIDTVLADAKPEDRDKFLQGLAWIDGRSENRFHQRFVDAQPVQQIELLTGLSTEAAPSPVDAPGVEFFQAIKGMTITGFYTSEPGLLQEIGDDGQVFFTEFKGCEHKEHGAPEGGPAGGWSLKAEGQRPTSASIQRTATVPARGHTDSFSGRPSCKRHQCRY